MSSVTTLAQLHKAATALPEVDEGTHFGMIAFSVRGKGFASMTKQGHVQLRLSAEESEAAAAEHAGGELVVRNGKPIGVRVPLDNINGKDLNGLVRNSWLHCAPKGLVESVRAAESAEPSSELPAAIGRPATRALAREGLTTLDDVATRSQPDLLALHGVGPKAIRILKETMDQRGISWR